MRNRLPCLIMVRILLLNGKNVQHVPIKKNLISFVDNKRRQDRQQDNLNQ